MHVDMVIVVSNLESSEARQHRILVVWESVIRMGYFGVILEWDTSACHLGFK